MICKVSKLYVLYAMLSTLPGTNNMSAVQTTLSLSFFEHLVVLSFMPFYFLLQTEYVKNNLLAWIFCSEMASFSESFQWIKNYLVEHDMVVYFEQIFKLFWPLAIFVRNAVYSILVSWLNVAESDFVSNTYLFILLSKTKLVYYLVVVYASFSYSCSAFVHCQEACCCSFSVVALPE